MLKIHREFSQMHFSQAQVKHPFSHTRTHARGHTHTLDRNKSNPTDSCVETKCRILIFHKIRIYFNGNPDLLVTENLKVQFIFSATDAFQHVAV